MSIAHLPRLAPNTSSFTLLLGVCAGLPALTIDLSAPTLTILPAALGTTVTIAGLSLSLFMVGFAVGQFAGGRSSDMVGRRPVLLFSTALYVLGGLCCSMATSGPCLVAARLVQGLGAGACAVQAVAMVQDLFEGEAARRKQSYVNVVLTIMPMVAPAIGTFFIAQWGWRSVHIVLAAAGALLASAVGLLVAESHPASERRRAPGLGIRDSLTILRDRPFRRLVAVNALSYGAVFGYIAGAPAVVMDDLRQPPLIYAGLFAGTAMALACGAFSNAWFSHRGIPGERLVWPGLLAQAGASAALILADAGLEHGGMVAAVPLLLIGTFARGLLSPNLVHLAVSRHRGRAGLAAALVGLVQLSVGALASAVVAALLSPFGPAGVAVVMAVLACAAAVVWRGTSGADTPRSREPDRNCYSEG